MNKTLLAVAAVALVIAGLYLTSPFSKSSRSLRVFIKRERSFSSVGYQAIIVNDGFLPVFVDTCDSVGEGARIIAVPDAIQRFEGEGWRTALDRRGCHEPPEGTHEKQLTPKLLWPRQTILSSYFVPNVGFAGFPFKHGDRLRFLVFAETAAHGPDALSSPEFTID